MIIKKIITLLLYQQPHQLLFKQVVKIMQQLVLQQPLHPAPTKYIIRYHLRTLQMLI